MDMRRPHISMSEGSSTRRRGREKKVIIADVGRMEEDFWNGEPLVIHRQGLYALVQRFTRLAYAPGSIGGVIWKDVLLDDRVIAWPCAGRRDGRKRGSNLAIGIEEHCSEQRTDMFQGPWGNLRIRSSTPP